MTISEHARIATYCLVAGGAVALPANFRAAFGLWLAAIITRLVAWLYEGETTE